MAIPLPLGIQTQTFRETIEGGYIYADKTGHILRMIRSRKSVFLSRPRRFGKSLLLSAIIELLLDRPELFKGLSIESTVYDFAPRPVLRLLERNRPTPLPSNSHRPESPGLYPRKVLSPSLQVMKGKMPKSDLISIT
jgi:hypothetical protein